ncbi:MAG: peroxide stress protein YaaA [Thiotrichaceae bacterium]|nr:peroxide stress protein YaaA [Thiotrichaceae bacterium]
MLITLSPSKGQDFDSPAPIADFTIPEQLDNTLILNKQARQLTIEAIRELMTVSENIAKLNHQRFQTFSTPFTLTNAKQALFAFKGDVYTGISAVQFSEEDIHYAQDHLRMLSGLYGALRPLDLMQPYRLEMKTKLANPRGDNLYQFWGEIITEQLNQALEGHKEKVLINLASNEYFKSVKPKALKAKLLTITFKEEKEGKVRIIAIFAKRARGMMTDYIIRHRIETVEGIKGFEMAGYRYSAEYSDDKQMTFVRPQPQKKN